MSDALSSMNATLSRGAAAAPVIVRLVIGLVMAAHGWQKLTQMGAGNFGNGMLADLGVPLAGPMGYVVTYAELVGGVLLIVGLLSRLTAAVLAVVLAVATILVKVDIGLIAGMGAPLPGAELDLALIAGLVVTLLLGPGRPSLDHLLSIERGVTPVPATIDVTEKRKVRATSR